MVNNGEINQLNQENSKTYLSRINPVAFILLSLITIFITYQFFGAALQLIFVGAEIPDKTAGIYKTRAIISLSQFLFILLPVFALNQLQKGNIKETFKLKKPDLTITLLGILGIIFIQPFLQLYLYLQNKIIFSISIAPEFIKQLKTIFDSLEAMTLKLVATNSTFEFIFVIFVIAVTPAICEEFFFRGLILKNFERATTPSKAIFFTGLIFALFHFHPFNLIPLIALGIYLTYVVYYSGSIFPGVIMHFIFNSISAGSVFLYGKESVEDMEFAGKELMQFVSLGVVSLIIFIIIIVLIKKKYRRLNNV